MVSTERSGKTTRTVQIDGTEPIEVDCAGPFEEGEWTVVRASLGFECASGDWIEREWVGIPVLELLDAAAIPGETTHVQFSSNDGDRACVALADLKDAIIAVGDADGTPRFVSPHVIGPRTIKNLARVRPLALSPGEDREAYEELPLDED